MVDCAALRCWVRRADFLVRSSGRLRLTSRLLSVRPGVHDAHSRTAQQRQSTPYCACLRCDPCCSSTSSFCRPRHVMRRSAAGCSFPMVDDSGPSCTQRHTLGTTCCHTATRMTARIRTHTCAADCRPSIDSLESSPSSFVAVSSTSVIHSGYHRSLVGFRGVTRRATAGLPR